MRYSVDGGLTWLESNGAIRIIYEDMYDPDEDDHVELHMITSEEGMILDLVADGEVRDTATFGPDEMVGLIGN